MSSWARRLVRGGDVARAVSQQQFVELVARGSGSSASSKAGVTVSTTRAMGLTAWYSGCRFLAEGVAFLPIHTFRRQGFGDAQTKQRRADPPWLVRPDDEMPFSALVEHWMMSLLHRGNAYAFKLRDSLGRVSGLRELHPDRVRVVIAPDNRKRFVIDGDTSNLFTSRDVFHVPGLAYDGRVGLNPIQVHAEALGAAVAADDFASRWFAQGTHVGGLITVPERLTPAQAQQLRAEWDRFHQGLKDAHQTGVLGNGASYSRVSLSAADAQLLESRQYGVTEIARMLRLPPHKLYDLSHATFSNIEHQSIEAVTDGLQPWCERIECFLNFDLDLSPRDTYVEFELSGRLRGDTATRYGAYQTAVGAPFMSLNEARRLENLPAVDGGDTVLAPLNMAAVGAGPERMTVADLVAALQRVGPAVDTVITRDEARAILNRAGLDLPATP